MFPQKIIMAFDKDNIEEVAECVEDVILYDDAFKRINGDFDGLFKVTVEYIPPVFEDVDNEE